MNKTNPIGVRFRADLLEKLKTDYDIESPQKALVFYERFYVTWSHLGKETNTALRDKTKQSGQKEAGKPIVSDLTQPTRVLNPQEQPKTNFATNTKPKTLDELKSLCPFKENGAERSEWIRENRVKYNI